MPEGPIFSTRQRQALTLLASGMDERAIAAKLLVAPTMVSSDIDDAMRNLGMRCRADLLAHVTRHGISRRKNSIAAPTCRFTLYRRQPDGFAVEIHAYEIACHDGDVQANARAALWTLPLATRQDLVVVTNCDSGDVVYRRHRLCPASRAGSSLKVTSSADIAHSSCLPIGAGPRSGPFRPKAALMPQ